MKFKGVILCAAMLVFGAGAANASSTWIGLNGGATVPTGDYSNAVVTGFQFGVLGTQMMNDQWGIGADLDYHMWNSSSDANTAAELIFGPGSEFKWSALQATGHVVMNIPTPGMVTPYIKGGVGLYNLGLKLDSPLGSASDSKAKFGFNLGGGVNLATSPNMKWGVNAAYHIVPAKNDLGADVDAVTVGLNLMWGVGL